MGPDLFAWLPLAVKLALTALIVVSASVLSERAGALIGAMVVTLPVTVWPAYFFLSLDHDADFVAQSALAGLAVNAVSGIFLFLYVVLAQRQGLLVSLGVALCVWIGLAYPTKSIAWTFGAAALFNLLVYSVCIRLASRYRMAVMPRLPRQWYDLPLRTLLVCTLMAVVLGISTWAGPVVTGIIAVFPISTTSTLLILHARVGGPASAAVIANGLAGMLGIGLGLTALNVAMPLGVAPALALALAVPVTWNMAVWLTNRHSVPA
jgi:hypothetical protein